MKILVCISHVPDTTSKITFTNDNKEFNTAGIQYIINPYDELALSRAVELAESDNAEVTVINVGETSTEPTIRKALAVGAAKAVRIDAAPRDAWYVANQIADYVKENEFDLILTGKESIDYNGAQVPSMLAELLNLSSVSITKKIDINDGKATVEREIEGGKEVLELPLPAVLGVSEGVAEVKIPNMRGIMGARSKPLEVVSAKEVPVLSHIESYEAPEARGAVTMIEEDNIDELINLLHTKSKVI